MKIQCDRCKIFFANASTLKKHTGRKTPCVAPAINVENTETAVVDDIAETTPIVIESLPVVIESAPIVRESVPVVIESVPIVIEYMPVVRESAPVVIESVPIVIESAPIVRESMPVVRGDPIIDSGNKPVGVDLTSSITCQVCGGSYSNDVYEKLHIKTCVKQQGSVSMSYGGVDIISKLKYLENEITLIKQQIALLDK